MPSQRGLTAVALIASWLFALDRRASAQIPTPDLRAQMMPTVPTVPVVPAVAPVPVPPVPGSTSDVTTAAGVVDPPPPPQPPGTTSDSGIGPPYGPPNVLPFGSGATGTPFAGWDDGFYLTSADRQFSLQITGQLQSDFRGYLDGNDKRDLDAFVMRRARFGLEATLFQYYDFRFLPDFGQGQTRLQDAYVDVHYWSAAQFTAGKFKQPMSYEQLIQDRFTPLMERSLIDQLVPQRDVGLMVHGENLLNGRIDYGLAVSNGEQNGDTDTNNSKDFNGRIGFRPFAAWDNPLRQLQFGVSGGFGVETESVNPSALHTPAGVQFFQFKSTVYANGVRARWTPVIAYFYKGFGFSTQYFYMNQVLQEKTGASPPIRVPFEGFYAQATYLLTGEERTGYSEQISPLHPFDPRYGLRSLGAWELVARLSRLQVGADAFAPGPTQLVSPAGNSSGATELTLGYNWYLNRWVRVQCNYEHAWFDQHVRLGVSGPNGLHSVMDSLMFRFQIIF